MEQVEEPVTARPAQHRTLPLARQAVDGTRFFLAKLQVAGLLRWRLAPRHDRRRGVPVGRRQQQLSPTVEMGERGTYLLQQLHGFF